MHALKPNHHKNNDEIDLFELAQVLWNEKVLGFLITAAIVVSAVIYMALATPVYQANTIIKPATNKDFDALNLTGILNLTPDEALLMVSDNLQSHESRRDFFKHNQALLSEYLDSGKTLDENIANFNESALEIISPNTLGQANVNNYVKLQIKYSKDTDGATIVNELMSSAINNTKQRIAESIAVKIKNRVDRLHSELTALRAGYQTEVESKIASLSEADNIKKMKLQDELSAIRSSLKSNRENRIKRLDEAIIIASSLGIKRPTTPSGFRDAEVRVSGSVIKTEVNNNQAPLYFMGTDALEAEKSALLSRDNDDFTSTRIIEIQQELELLRRNPEIEALRSRKNYDLFLDNIADRHKEITRLKNIQLNFEDLKLVYIDKVAINNKQAVKRSKQLIIAVAIVLGLLLGAFTALIKHAIIKRHKA